MALGQVEGLLKCPPYAQSGDANRRVTQLAISGAAAGLVLAAPTITPTGNYVSWISDTDCYVNWGNSASQIFATSSISVFMPAGVVWDFWHTPKDDWVSVIQKTAGGKLYFWRSNF